MIPLGSAPRNQWRVSAEAVDLVRPPAAPRPLALPAEPQNVTLDLGRTALLVIDMQNDFCHPEGWLASLGLPKNGAKVLEAGSWAAAVIDELTPEPGDIAVAKYRMSGFWDTPLDSILRNLGVTTLLFAGVNLDQCVLCTLQDANFLGYDCVLLADCAATTSPEYCTRATLYNVKQCFGFVAQSPGLLRGLEG